MLSLVDRGCLGIRTGRIASCKGGSMLHSASVYLEVRAKWEEQSRKNKGDCQAGSRGLRTRDAENGIDRLVKFKDETRTTESHL